MNRVLRRVITAVGTLAILAAGGSVALAWSVDGSSGTAAARAAGVPRVDRPATRTVSRSVTIRWTGVQLVTGVPADGYVVTRHGGRSAGTVCRVPRRVRLCVDLLPGPGLRTYTVRATFARWVGPHSEPSTPVALPAESSVASRPEVGDAGGGPTGEEPIDDKPTGDEPAGEEPADDGPIADEQNSDVPAGQPVAGTFGTIDDQVSPAASPSAEPEQSVTPDPTD